MEQRNNRLSFTIEEGRKNIGFSRTRMYGAIADGSLATFKVGRRRMVSARALADFIERMEAAGAATVAS